METFSIELTDFNKDNLDALSEIMAKMQDATIEYIQKLAQELGISDACAMDVYYLRTRSRWTQELETELIRLHKEGNVPNMCDYGCK